MKASLVIDYLFDIYIINSQNFEYNLRIYDVFIFNVIFGISS